MPDCWHSPGIGGFGRGPAHHYRARSKGKDERGVGYAHAPQTELRLPMMVGISAGLTCIGSRLGER